MQIKIHSAACAASVLLFVNNILAEFSPRNSFALLRDLSVLDDIAFIFIKRYQIMCPDDHFYGRN